MAILPKPPGEDQFPSRQELSQQLGPVLGDTRSLGANRGYRKFDELSDIYENQSDVYYAPKSVNPRSSMETGSDESVAFTDSDVPTSSTDYSRPRTVAAGYDPERQTMTVVFRDGTFYNYYSVTETEWLAFKASISKGNPWLNRRGKSQSSDGLFISKPRGVADVSSISPEIREALYRVSRTQQIRSRNRLGQGKQPRSTAVRRQAGLKAAYKRNPGRNPSKPRP
jgi:hypothetical protein